MKKANKPVTIPVVMNRPFIIDDNTKDVIVRHFSDIRTAEELFVALLNKNALTEDHCHTVFGTFRVCMEAIGTKIGYSTDDEVQREKDRTTALLREKNEEIRNLKALLGKDITSTGVAAKVSEYKSFVNDWWQELGFTYTHEMKILPSYGNNAVCEVEFYTNADKPFGEMDFTDEGSGYNFYLTDSDKNKELLDSLFKEKFPTAHISNSVVFSIKNTMCIQQVTLRIPMKDFQ